MSQLGSNFSLITTYKFFFYFTEPESVAESAAPSGGGDTAGFIQYRALYDYASENADDLAFKAGDTIIVNPDQPHEPGWLGGELNGQVG